MAAIYTQYGEIITDGLQSDKVSSEAMQAAKSYAKERGEVVHLVDGDDEYRVFPSGQVELADAEDRLA